MHLTKINMEVFRVQKTKLIFPEWIYGELKRDNPNLFISIGRHHMHLTITRKTREKVVKVFLTDQHQEGKFFSWYENYQRMRGRSVCLLSPVQKAQITKKDLKAFESAGAEFHQRGDVAEITFPDFVAEEKFRGTFSSVFLYIEPRPIICYP